MSACPPNHKLCCRGTPQALFLLVRNSEEVALDRMLEVIQRRQPTLLEQLAPDRSGVARPRL